MPSSLSVTEDVKVAPTATSTLATGYILASRATHSALFASVMFPVPVESATGKMVVRKTGTAVPL